MLGKLLDNKLILSLTIAGALSIASSAFAFSGNVSTPIKIQKNTVYISNETIDNGAQKFVTKLTKQGIGIIENNDISKEKREKEFHDLLHKNFDMKTIARFALGRYWKTSSDTEKKEYLTLFEDMIVDVYSRRFSEYNGQEIDVISARTEGRADAIVSSIIIPQTGPKIRVDWRVRKKKNDQFKIIDIMVEGVSMSLTQRSDFASVIQRGGGKVEVLLAHLRP